MTNDLPHRLSPTNHRGFIFFEDIDILVNGNGFQTPKYFMFGNYWNIESLLLALSRRSAPFDGAPLTSAHFISA